MHLRSESLVGRVALVTGASSGIGYETARLLAERGCVVIGVARRESRLRELTERCRRATPGSDYLVGDLGERAFAERAVAETLARHGRIDILVNNAAMPKRQAVGELDPDEVERVLRVNFLACVWTTLAALPRMLERHHGCIVNVGSFAAEVVPPRETAYAASKGALASFTQGLWSDLAGTGVHAALVVPGPIDTEIWQGSDEASPYRGRRHPPDRVARAIVRTIARRRHEVLVPRSPSLLLARLLRHACPGLLRASLARMARVPVARHAPERPAARSESGAQPDGRP